MRSRIRSAGACEASFWGWLLSEITGLAKHLRISTPPQGCPRTGTAWGIVPGRADNAKSPTGAHAQALGPRIARGRAALKSAVATMFLDALVTARADFEAELELSLIHI